MTDTTKPNLYVHDTCVASVANTAHHMASNAINCTRAILVTTRERTSRDHYSPSEFLMLLELDGIKRGRMTGAALFIDAQPVYDSGRVFPTIKTEQALQMARLAIQKHGKLLNHIVVVCDQGERAAIEEAIKAEIAAC